MHSVLFVAAIPDRDRWSLFVMDVSLKMKDPKGSLRLAENVWLLNLHESPRMLGWLIAYADARGVTYGILPFEFEPQWLPGDLDPKTMEAQNADSR